MPVGFGVEEVGGESGVIFIIAMREILYFPSHPPFTPRPSKKCNIVFWCEKADTD